jgi:hypothetical protein
MRSGLSDSVVAPAEGTEGVMLEEGEGSLDIN